MRTDKRIVFVAIVAGIATSGFSGELLLWNGFEGLTQADISDTVPGLDADGNGIPDGYGLNFSDDTVALPLLTGEMVHYGAQDRTLERTIFVQPVNGWSGMLLVNDERAADETMPSNQGLIKTPVHGALGSDNFIMMFDGGFANGMITVIENAITTPGEHTLSLYAKVFDEDADGDGVNAELTADGGDVNEDITALYVQFGPFEFPLIDAFRDDFVNYFNVAATVAGDPALAEGEIVSAPAVAADETNPADAPYDGEWVKISATYNFDIVPAHVAITLHCAYPFPGLDGALDITAMAMDHFTLSGPSFPDTAVELWPVY